MADIVENAVAHETVPHHAPAHHGMDSNEKMIHQIRLLEQLEDWENMFEHCSQLVPQLGNDDMEHSFPFLLSNCVTHRLGNGRSAFMEVEAVARQEEYAHTQLEDQFDSHKKEIGEKYLKCLYHELDKKVEESVELIKKAEHKAHNQEAKCVYERTIADAYRYLCDCAEKEDEIHGHHVHSEKAEHAYNSAKTSAMGLDKCNEHRLRCMNNYAIFQYEHKGDTKKAFETCIEEYNGSAALEHRHNAEAQLVRQMLHDNIICWQIDYENQPRHHPGLVPPHVDLHHHH